MNVGERILRSLFALVLGQMWLAAAQSPVLAAPAPPLEQRPRQPAVGPANIRFVLKGLRVTGETVFKESTLLTTVQSFIGKTVGFADLDEAAARISRLYHEHGYSGARAYIPVQDIRHGVVEIAVLEGRTGVISAQNQ